MAAIGKLLCKQFANCCQGGKNCPHQNSTIRKNSNALQRNMGSMANLTTIIIVIIIVYICPIATSIFTVSPRIHDLTFCTPVDGGSTGQSVIAHATLSKCVEMLSNPENFLAGGPPSAFILYYGNSSQLIDFVLKITRVQDSWRTRQIKHLLWLPSILVVIGPNSMSKNVAQSSLVLSNPIFREIPIDSLIFIVDAFVDKNGKNFWFWEVNSIKNDIPKFFNHVNNNGNNYDYIYWPELGAIGGRRNFLKNRLKVAGIASKKKWKYLWLRQVNKTRVIFEGGYLAQLLWMLEEALDFTIEGVYADSAIWPHVNDGVNGIGQQILEGEADLCISLHTFQPYRAKYLFFLQPIYPENLHAYFRPPPKSAVRNMFTLPFNRQLWVVMGTSFLVILLIFGLIEWILWWVRKWWALKKKNEETQIFEKVDDIILWTLAAACLQNTPRVESWTQSHRLVFASAIFLATLLNIFYTGSIASAIMLDVAPLKTFQQLAHHGYLLLADEFSRIFLSFAMANGSKGQWAVEEGNRHFIGNTDSVQKAMNLNSPFLYAAVVTTDLFDSTVGQLNYSTERICQLSTIRFGGSLANMAMMIQKGSQYKELLSVKTITLIERGLLFVQNSRHNQLIVPSCQSPSDKLVGYEVLGLPDFFLAVKIMGIGASVAAAIFFVEVMVGRSSRIKDRVAAYVDKRRFEG